MAEYPTGSSGPVCHPEAVMKQWSISNVGAGHALDSKLELQAGGFRLRDNSSVQTAGTKAHNEAVIT